MRNLTSDNIYYVELKRGKNCSIFPKIAPTVRDQGKILRQKFIFLGA